MADKSNKKSISYLEKEVTFHGSKMTLYSIDGAIWSTKKEELLDIQVRLEEKSKSLLEAFNKSDNSKKNKSESKAKTNSSTRKAKKEKKTPTPRKRKGSVSKGNKNKASKRGKKKA